MKRASWVLSLLLVLACSSDSPVAPPGPGATNCGLGPISAPNNAPRPCPIASGCPRMPPTTARTVVLVSACAFGEDAASCTPIPTPMCPVDQVAIHSLLYDPNKPGSICTADINVRIQPGESNQTRILWDAQELQDAPGGGCRNVGPEYEGESTVNGPCCQQTVDIWLPIMKRTFRMAVQTDWTESTKASSAVVAGPAIEVGVPLFR